MAGRLCGLAAVVCLGAWDLPACSVDRDLAKEGGPYTCVDDRDCLSGYVCRPDVDGALRCGPEVFGPRDQCEDLDQDNYLAGPGCPQATLQDCNDGNPSIHPGVEEACDNVNQDCDDNVDEDIPPSFCDQQFGVCAGAMRTCVDGALQDCVALGLYGPDYEDVPEAQESCDGLDNNCLGGYPANARPQEIDAHCECLPGVTGPAECDFAGGVGSCQRGIRFCQDDGSFSDCALAELGPSCQGDGDCGANGFCIDEVLDFREDYFDACMNGSEDACRRRVCRTLAGTVTCAGDGDCAASEVCAAGACQARAQAPTDETCNGLDDNCDGRFDDGAACAPCPFDMVFLDGIPGAPLGLCMARWEASRPDASAGDAGSNSLYAVAQAGVLPWTGVDELESEDACAGTALNAIVPGAIGGPVRFPCEGNHLAFACDGDGGGWPYGEAFQAGACNDATAGSGLEPTGSHTACCVGDICDLSGNAAEIVGSPLHGTFGGSADDSDAQALACDVTPAAEGPDESVVGFRCCAIPAN